MRKDMIDYSAIPMLPCPSTYKRARPNGLADAWWIVIHTMESPETANTAENVANWLSQGADGRKASVHYCIDNNSIIQMAMLSEQTCGAAGGNTHGIHLELAGKASQKNNEVGMGWDDPYSRDLLRNAAKLIAFVVAKKCKIPIVRLRIEDLKRGDKGLCGHRDITKAFHQGSHTDPGMNFPWINFLSKIKSYQK